MNANEITFLEARIQLKCPYCGAFLVRIIAFKDDTTMVSIICEEPGRRTCGKEFIVKAKIAVDFECYTMEKTE